MTSLQHRIVVGMALLALIGCTRAESAAATQTASAGLTAAPQAATGIWEFEVGGGYVFSCSDECGAPNCNCIRDTCSGNLVGQACSPVGDECNIVNGKTSYRTIECEAVETPTPTWTRITTSSCGDECGAPNCNCITDRCAGNPENQPCSPVGDTCNVISGPNFVELHCTAP